MFNWNDSHTYIIQLSPLETINFILYHLVVSYIQSVKCDCDNLLEIRVKTLYFNLGQNFKMLQCYKMKYEFLIRVYYQIIWS